MASFKVLFFLSLHALFFISSSRARLFHPLPISDTQVPIEGSESQNKAHSADEVEKIDRRFEHSRQFSGLGQIALAVDDAKEAGETNHDLSKQFPRSRASKRALVEEAREAIKARMQRNAGNLLVVSMRLSPGGPDPHHH